MHLCRFASKTHAEYIVKALKWGAIAGGYQTKEQTEKWVLVAEVLHEYSEFVPQQRRLYVSI